MEHKPYPSDLTDEQWDILAPLIPRARPGGRPRKTVIRRVVDAVLYINRQGCTWRALPHDFPPWKTVYNYFQAWSRDGTWQRILDVLRPRLRVRAGRSAYPSAAAIDSQSVKTAEGGEACGTDGGKKVHGRKRHILVDSMGLLIAIVVTAANVDDAKAAQAVLAQVPGSVSPFLQVIFADNKYHNHELDAWLVRHRRPYELRVVSRETGEKRFVPLPIRWLVERTLAWLGRSRRLSKDYEHTVASSEAMIRISAIHHLLRRLAPKRVAHSQRFRFKGHQRKKAA